MKTLTETQSWLDLGAGLGLLVPSLADRMMAAMLQVEHHGLDRAGDLEHVTALAIGRLVAEGKIEPWISECWMKLSQHYHQNHCPDCRADKATEP